MNLPKGIQNCVFPILLIALALPISGQATKKTAPDIDSTRISAWRMNTQWMEQDSVHIDTLLTSYQVYNPVNITFFNSAFLGNLGQPAINNMFSQRHYSTGFIFMQSLEPYLLAPEKNIYFNTRRPYTNIQYTNAPSANKNEEMLNITHTQNITPNLNAGIYFNIYASPGLYPSQRTKDRTFTAHTNYQAKKYSLYGAYFLNKFTNQESGGLINDSSVYDKNQDYLPVNLDFATSRFVSNTFYLLQSYDLGHTGEENDSVKRKINLPRSTVSLTLEYDRSSKSFFDTDLKDLTATSDPTSDSAYFKHFYLNPAQTYDSVIYRKFSTQLRYSLKDKTTRFPFYASFLVTQDVLRYGFYREAPTPDTSTIKNKTFTSTTLANFRAGVILSFGQPQRWQWRTLGYYTFVGYNFGDYLLQATMSLGLGGAHHYGIQLDFTSRLDKPDYLLSNFFSNSEMWDNTFKKTLRDEASAKIMADGSPILGADLIHLNHYVYLNDSGYPAQYGGNIVVADFYLNKTFRYWKMVSANTVAVQYATDSRVIPLPLASAFLSNYLEAFLVKNVLLTEIGFDIRYNTAFYGYSYDPITGSFHTQSEKQIGNYPYIDLFVNLKLKRTRAYLKYEHANYGRMTRDYFNALHYPMNKGLFKFGLSWDFYD